MLKHVSFVTRDADAVRAFYTGLGAEVRKDFVTPEGFRRLVLEFQGGGKLQFFEQPGASAAIPPQREVPHPWMEHVALHLPDLPARLEELRARGVTFSRELSLSPGGTKVAFVLDPDGRHVELLESS